MPPPRCSIEDRGDEDERQRAKRSAPRDENEMRERENEIEIPRDRPGEYYEWSADPEIATTGSGRRP